MHLQRVQVPDFRVLKDIDITFEKDFFPRIFPLGSLNGGGKSTLLQLIFILLHCSADPEKHEFIQNLLEGFTIPDGSDKRAVANFEIWNGEKKVNLDYFLLPKDAFEKLLESDAEKIGYEFFSRFSEEEEIELEEEKIKFLVKRLQQTKGLKPVAKLFIVKEEYSLYPMLCCQFTGIEFERIDQFLVDLSKNIFLASPSTQIFLFLNPEYRKLLFQQNQGHENYSFRTQEAKSKLINFYPYDALSVDILIDTFKRRRDQDFEVAIETGQYGKNYERFFNDINTLLIDKKINIAKGLSSINFKAERNSEIIELYPEDLSHGELKRLSLYVWLKYSNIEDAIILFDEIEIALHPDWQYQIIRDLEEWGPTNQYILATHSYELCQALTPAHVKEIEPKLLNQINN